MKNKFSISTGLLLGLSFILTSCASIETLMGNKVDPERIYTFGSEFMVKFAMPGDWYLGKSSNGMFIVGQKPLEDGTTKLAVLRRGPIATPDGNPMSNADILKGFRMGVEREAIAERLTEVKTKFVEKKYNKADCLEYFQTATDKTPKGTMAIANDGFICLHPRTPSIFIWLAISERRPTQRAPSNLALDEKMYFQSLEFLLPPGE